MTFNRNKLLTRNNWFEFECGSGISTANKLRICYQNEFDDYPLMEVFFMYKHNLFERPKCTCNNDLKFLSYGRGYRKHCSNRCSKLDNITEEKYKKSLLIKHNISHVSELIHWKENHKKSQLLKDQQSIYENVKKTNLIKYGVEHTFQTKELKYKTKIKNIKNGKWFSSEIKRNFDSYKQEVWCLTKQQNLKSLNNYEKRGRADLVCDAYHLDHKLSITDGFNNGILPYIIANINNLEMLPYKENCSKGVKSSITILELYNLINEKEKDDKRI